MSKAKPAEPKKYESKQPQVKLQSKKQTEVEKYFKQLSTKSQSFIKVTKQAESGQNNVLKSIKKGKLQIKEVPNDIQQLLIKQKINEDELKAEQLKIKRQEILQAISKLDMRVQKSNQSLKTIGKQYSNPDLLNYKPNSVLSKEQHEALVQKIKQAQEIQDQRNEQRLYRLQKQFLEQQENIKKLQQQKLKSEKQLRRRRSQYKLSLRQQIQQLQNAEQLRSKRELSQLKKKNHLHQILQQKYNNTVVIPSLQQKKKKLKQIRQFNKSSRIAEINEHQKKYLKQRNKSMHLIQSKAKVSDQWIYKPPQKTERLTKILDQELSNKKKQINKHKKQIQEKLLREQNYVRLLKQKHVPKLDKNLQDQLSSRVQKMHTKPKQITVNAKQIGKNYLVEAKKMKKQMSQSSIKIGSQQQEVQKAQLQSSRINYLVRNQDNHYYAQKRKQQLQKIINSEQQAKQKAKKLQFENRKIQQAYKRKQQLFKTKADKLQTRNDAAQLLLSGIKAKMGLIKLVQ